MKVLTELDLRKKVPSIFSLQASAKTSQKYSLIPTIECVQGLQRAGFMPVQAFESRCNNVENKPYVKHLMRFRKEGIEETKSEVPEIIMINSHNGGSSYQLRAGVYRLICSNGLIVGSDMFFRRIIHKGDVVPKLVDAAMEIVEMIPATFGIVEKWKGITLQGEARQIYADSAALLKWDKEEMKISPDRLLLENRWADKKQDLWTTFNVVQENLIKGGVSYFDRKAHRRGTTRAVHSVGENARLNTALWNLTERMASLSK